LYLVEVEAAMGRAAAVVLVVCFLILVCPYLKLLILLLLGRVVQ
tara:strand:- start:601 stop:732 length:132 start_codon:yes stop_codon:yes gene_type:complete